MPYTVLDSPIAQPPALPWETTLTHNVNIRREPSLGNNIVRTAQRGERLILTELVLGEQVEARGTRAWFRVEGGGVVYGGVLTKVEHAQ